MSRRTPSKSPLAHLSNAIEGDPACAGRPARGRHTLGRRDFVSGAALAGASALTASAWGRVSGSNGDLRVAVTGLNGKGRDHLKAFSAMRGVRVVALCDVDSAVLARAVAQAKGLGQSVKTYEDFREVLARNDVDAVSVVTPNHQHAMQAIWAMQAGKHLFLEKPVSHDLWEGRQLVAAQKKYARGVVAANIQSRSSPPIAEALEYVKSGALGRVLMVRGLCYKRRASLGKTSGPQPVPPTVNYDLWRGPAGPGPLRRSKLHYDWHWQWASGNGDIANQGNHQMDVGRRFLGDPGLPSRVESVGGRLGYDDDGETPNTLVTVLHYSPAPFVFEVRGLPAKQGAETMDTLRGLSVGNVVECEGGYVTIPSRDYSLAVAFDPKGREVKRFTGKGNHYEKFVQAVRSGRSSDSNCTLESAVVTAALSHLPNVSQQVGTDRPLGWLRSSMPAGTPYGEAFSRMAIHLGDNGLTPEDRVRLGAPLTVDAATQQFVGQSASAARSVSRRDYRAPFVVPHLV